MLHLTARFRWSILGIVPLFGISACAMQPTSVSQAQPPSTWTLLQQGTGYVVMMRHALAPGVGDPASFKLGDCSTQRNLSAEGRQQARQLGQAFRDRKIPLFKVLSSQWCRCLETAKLLDLGTVEPFPALNSFFQNPGGRDPQTRSLRKFMIENRNTPGVILMVTHQVNITELTGAVPQSGASVVLKADGRGQIKLIGELPPP